MSVQIGQVHSPYVLRDAVRTAAAGIFRRVSCASVTALFGKGRLLFMDNVGLSTSVLRLIGNKASRSGDE
jgi:hypothetical protein